MILFSICFFKFYQKTPADHRWDETPHHKGNETPATPSARMWDPTPAHQTPGRQAGAETPAHEKSTRRNRWDETPKTERETPGHNSGWAETPRTDRIEADKTIESATPGTASKRRSRWDEMTPSMTTPSGMGATPQMTPSMTPSVTPGHATPLLTPGGEFPTCFQQFSTKNNNFLVFFRHNSGRSQSDGNGDSNPWSLSLYDT